MIQENSCLSYEDNYFRLHIHSFTRQKELDVSNFFENRFIILSRLVVIYCLVFAHAVDDLQQLGSASGFGSFRF